MYDSPQSLACYLHTRFAWYSYPPGVFVTDSPLSYPPTRQCYCATALSAFVSNLIPGLRKIVSRLISSLQPTGQCY